MPLATTKSRELRRQLANAVQRGREIIDRAERENRGLTAEDREAIRKVHDDAAELKGKVEQAEWDDEIRQPVPDGLQNVVGSAVPRDSVNRLAGDSGRLTGADLALNGWLKSGIGIVPTHGELTALDQLGYSPGATEIKLDLPQHDALRGAALGHVRAGLSAQVFNALSVGIDTAGGFLVPRGFVRALEAAMIATGSMLQVSTVMRTGTGEDLPYPITNDTANEGAELPENTQAAELDISFGSLVLRSYCYTSKIVRVSNQLMRDAAVDVGTIVGQLLGERLGRILNRRCTTADGAARPTGIVTAATLGVTAAATNALDGDEIIQLVHSVDPSYRVRGRSGFMMHDGVFAEVSLLKDGNGDYLLKPGLAENGATTLRGWPVFPNQHMAAALAASEKVMLFGDLSKYLIRQVGTLIVRRFVERWGDYNQTGFLALLDFDGALLDAGAHPVKYLKMKT